MDTAFAEEAGTKTRKKATASPVAATAPKTSAALIDCAVEKEALAAVLGRVMGIVERRSTIPITGNIKIEVLDGQIAITGTDLDMYAVETVEAGTHSTPGYATTVPAHTLHEIIAKLPKGAQIKLSLGREPAARLKIQTGRSNFQLSILPAKDFPDAMTGKVLPVEFNVDAQGLHRLLSKTSFAMSTEETRYYLNGVYFHPADAGGTRKLRAVAADGHRLARIGMAWPKDAPDFKGVILPRKLVETLLKLLGNAEEGDTVALALSESSIRATVGALTLTSKLIDGSFPDYARVIPSMNKKRAKITTEDLTKAVDRVSVLSSEKGRSVKLFFREDTLTVSCGSPEYGSSEEDVDADFSAEGTFEIGFNARYVLDVTSQLGDEMEMQLADCCSPTLILAPGECEETTDALFVLMPMRT